MQSAQFDLHAQIEEQHWWFVARRQILRRLAEQLVPPGEGHLVVDVGCGTGANLAALANGYRAVGIDTSPAAIELARARFPQHEFRCGFAPADLSDCLPHASLVLLTDVLEHVPDDFQLLSSLLAALRPGACLLLTVPADERLWSPHDESFGHYRRYDRQRLAQSWEGLPVKTRLLSYFNTRLYPAVRLVRSWNRWRGETAGAAGTDFRLPWSPVNRALTAAFAGEAERLLALLNGRTPRPYLQGVSLVAVLERETGRLEPRARPAHIPADLHQPCIAASETLNACSA